MSKYGGNIMGPTSIKNAYCGSCSKRSYLGGFCRTRGRVIRGNEILSCMFDGANFINGKAPLQEGEIIHSWDDFYEDYKSTKPKVVNSLYYCRAFADFLTKVDKTGQGTLIEELFDGKEETYIDSPGDFKTDPDQYEHSVIYSYVATCTEPDLIELFAYWCRNLKKCYEWTYSKRLRSPLKLSRMRK